jgi:hypothetical protein
MPTPVTKAKKPPSEKLRLFSVQRFVTGCVQVRLRPTKASLLTPEVHAVAHFPGQHVRVGTSHHDVTEDFSDAFMNNDAEAAVYMGGIDLRRCSRYSRPE